MGTPHVPWRRDGWVQSCYREPVREEAGGQQARLPRGRAPKELLVPEICPLARAAPAEVISPTVGWAKLVEM